MEAISTVTQKGQVTIPKKMRDRLGLKPYKRVKLKQVGEEVKITAELDLLDLAGTFIPRKNKNLDPVKARAYMETHYKRV